MKKIADLFGRAGLIRPPAETLRQAARQAIKKIIGPKVKLADLTVRGRTLFVRAGPIVKSQLFFKKREVLNFIKEKVGPEKEIITEIR